MKDFLIRKIFPVLILSILLIPFYLFLANYSDNAINENRVLAKKPSLESVFEIPKYLNQFDSYFADNFPFRAKAIFALSYIKFFTFGVSAHENVLIGKENMMYLFTKNSGDTIGDYRGINYFNAEELNQIEANILTRMELLKKKNIKFYLVFAPNKESIYPENIPNSMKKYKNRNRFDQLVEHLKKNKEIPFVSLKDNLLKEKVVHPYLFYHYDTHWNKLGAYFGYQGILNIMRSDFKEILIHPLSDFEVKEEFRHLNGYLIRQIGIGDFLSDRYIEVNPKFKRKAIQETEANLEAHNYKYSTSEKKFPNAYFWCDSFLMYGPRDLLAESFNDSYFVWLGMPHDPERIPFSKINIIVFEMAERYIDLLSNPVKDSSKPWIF